MEHLERKIEENSRRINILESDLKSFHKENTSAHNRIEHKVDQVMDELFGFKYMAKGARWVAGFMLAVGLWMIHEWEVLKKFIRG